MFQWLFQNQKQQETLSFEKLAESKNACIKALKKDPSLLFKVAYHNSPDAYEDFVEQYDDTYNVLFIDLILKHKTLTDKDMFNIDAYILRNTPNKKGIDWYRLSRYMNFSREILEKKRYVIDWNHISNSIFYTSQDEDHTPYSIIHDFYAHIVWENVLVLTLERQESVKLVFLDRIFPLKHALRLRVIHKDDIVAYKDDCRMFLSEILFYYGADVVCRFDENDADVSRFILSHAQEFLRSCIRIKYIPSNDPSHRYLPVFIECLKSCSEYDVGEWFKICTPDEGILRTHFMPCNHPKIIDCISKTKTLSSDFIFDYEDVLNWNYIFASGNKFDEETIQRHLNKNTSEVISRYQQLSPEFIDKNNDVLDWYELCEHQNIPEWLMEKHIDKVNWGQISLYQNLSSSFMKEYWSMLNHIKLQKKITHVDSNTTKN